MADYFEEMGVSPLADGEEPDHLLHYARLLRDFGMYSLLSEDKRLPPPVAKDFFNNLKKETVALKEINCPVCLKEPDVGEVVTVLPCSHKYHSDCISPWLERCFIDPCNMYDGCRICTITPEHVCTPVVPRIQACSMDLSLVGYRRVFDTCTLCEEHKAEGSRNYQQQEHVNRQIVNLVNSVEIAEQGDVDELDVKELLRVVEVSGVGFTDDDLQDWQHEESKRVKTVVPKTMNGNKSSQTSTCPVCRLEMPTDDHIYEMYRKEKLRAKRREEEIKNLHNSMFS